MIFGVLMLLVVVAVVGVLAKKQVAQVSAPLPVVEGAPALPASGTQPQQVRQTVDDMLQQRRPVPDEK